MIPLPETLNGGSKRDLNKRKYGRECCFFASCRYVKFALFAMLVREKNYFGITIFYSISSSTCKRYVIRDNHATL